ncbi:hypothetical protein B1R94_27710 [Mycolicibacterium litorale]|nr:hypothetical protein B1R94_27710 [Mycolicibacterium litorale]
MTYTITYNHGAVSELAGDVGARAAQLMDIHDDLVRRTNAVADFFQGEAATAFNDAQMQMLKGLESLIETVARHGSVINNALEDAISTDQASVSYFA